MTPRHFAWQAWHLATSTFVSRGRRGTWQHQLPGVALMALGWVWWRAWGPLVARGAAALCVAGVALGDIHLRFAWQAWHLDIHLRFTWQAWHLATSTCSSTCNFFNLSILHHLLCLSFLPCPSSTLVLHYWKKLTCGVIRSFNLSTTIGVPPLTSDTSIIMIP